MATKTPQEQAAFAEVAGKLRYLLADPTGSRKSLRKLLTTVHIPTAQIDSAEKYAEAEKIIREKKPNVIFADETLDGPGGLALLEVQRTSVIDDGSPRIFFFATQKDSNAMMSGVADKNVDGLLLKPLTFDSVMEVFVTGVLRKIKPSPYDKAIQSGQNFLTAGNPEEALKLFRAALTLDGKPALACFWEGQALQAAGIPIEASLSYEKGLLHEPSHYRCLVAMLEALVRDKKYERAYEVGRKLSESHTVPVKLMPLLIRISVYNRKFDEVLSFFKDAEAMLQIDPKASESLAAALVVTGIWLLKREQKDQAVDAFRKAEVCGRSNPKIAQRIVVEMLSRGLTQEAKAMLMRLPAELRESEEIRLAELEYQVTPPGSEIAGDDDEL